MRVTVIGANGFIGRHACRALAERGHDVTAIVRRPDIAELAGAARVRHLEDAGPTADWHRALADAETVIHLASPPGADSPDPAARDDYRRVVVLGSEAMARAAAKQTTVKRLIFMSSIKVNGETTEGTPFHVDAPPRPLSAYGEFKLEAEGRLRSIADEHGLATTILRPPVVYGPGNLGNIYLLIRLFSRVPGVFVPLSGIENKRALIFVENLASALTRCVEDVTPGTRLFLIRDPSMVSTSELCRLILAALGRPAVLGPDPLGGVRRLVTALKPNLASRLYGSLEVHDDGIADTLGWTPPHTTAEGIALTVAALRDRA